MDKNRVRQRVRSLGKFNGIEQVVHLVPVPRLTQVLEHVEQPTVHWAIALCKEVRINRLIPFSIVGDAVALQSIAMPLDFPAQHLYSHLPCHLGW